MKSLATHSAVSGFMVLILMAVLVPLFPQGLSAQTPPPEVQVPTAEPRIEFRLRDGQVSVMADNVDLPADRQAALERHLLERTGTTPFARGGSVTIVLRGDEAVNFAARLRRIDISDRSAMNDALEDAAEELWEGDRFEARESSSRVVMGSEFVIGPGESIDQLVAIGATGRVDGRVRELVLLGSRVEPLAGEVEDLIALGSTVDVVSGGAVQNEVVSVGSRINLRPGSQMNAREVSVLFPGEWRSWGDAFPVSPVWGGTVGRFLWAATSYLFTFLFGALLIWAARGFHERTVATLEAAKGPSLGYGALGYLLAVPVAVLFVVTLIGILLIPLYVSVYIALVFFGYVAASSAVGRRLLRGRAANDFAVFALGLLLLKVISLIPFLGGVVTFFFTMAGFGAILQESVRTFRRRRSASVPPARGYQPAPA